MPTRICPSCKGKVSTSRSSCPHCQYTFNDKICPDCNETLDMLITECPTCGYVFNNMPSIGFGIGVNPNNNNNSNIKVEETKVESKNEKAAEFLICPQCGSSDIEMVSPTEGYCKYCHTKVYKKQETNINTKNITIINGNKETVKYQNKYHLKPSFSKEYVMKRLLTSLVNEDSPIETLNVNFDSLDFKEPLFIESSKVFQVSFQAKIGMDKKESYIDYEIYYERVPVNTQNGGVRYESVRKERPVTKYKNYIDWSPVASSSKVETDVFSSDERAYESYRNLVYSCIEKINTDELKSTDEDLKMSDYSKDCIELMDDSAIRRDIYSSLNGDHKDNINFEITSTVEVEDIYYIVPMYFLNIKYQGKTYTKYVCPIGNDLKIQGDKIVDESGSIEIYKKDKSSKKESQINKLKEECNKDVSKRRLIYLGPSIFAFILVLIAAIAWIRVAWVNWVLIIASIIGVIVTGVLSKKYSDKQNAILNKKINDIESKYQKDIKNFTTIRNENLRDALDKKLEELGIKNVID